MANKPDQRMRFPEDLKTRAVALAREGKVTREIGTELGLDKTKWQNIRAWARKAEVPLPKERRRTPGNGLARRTNPPAAMDPLAHILSLLEDPDPTIATLEIEREKVAQRLASIDKLLAVLRSNQ